MHLVPKPIPCFPTRGCLSASWKSTTIHIVEGEYRRYYILIPPSQLPQLVSEPRLRGVFVNRPADFCHVFCMQHFEEVESAWARLLTEVNTDQPLAELNRSSLLNLILIACYREHPERFAALFRPVNPANL